MGKGKNKEKKQIDVNFSVTYNNEKIYSNGEVVSSEEMYKSKKGNPYIYKPFQDGEVLYQNFYNTEDYVKVKPLTMEDLSKYYKTHDNSAEETLQYLQDFINANRNANKEVVQQTVSCLSEGLRQHFDHTNSSDGAGTTEEIFSKCFTAEKSANKEVKGLVCGPICNAMKDILNRCDIQAVIVPVINNVRHATLVYKQTDGEYVFNNYGQNAVIKAGNIKDAIAEYNKREGSLRSTGTLRLVNGDTTYSEYAYTDSAFRGNELNIHTYNAETPFQKQLKDTSSIEGNIGISNTNGVTADVAMNLAGNNNGGKEYNLSANLGYTKKGESRMFTHSNSFGLGAEYNDKFKKDNSTSYKGIKLQAAQITGEQGGIAYRDCSIYEKARNNAIADMTRDFNGIDRTSFSEEEQIKLNNDIEKAITHMQNTQMPLNKNVTAEKGNTSNLSFFTRAYMGKEFNIVQKGNTTLKGAGQVTQNILFSFDGGLSNSGDFRTVAEGGLKLENIGKQHTLKTNIGVGGVADYNEQIVSGIDFFRFGTKVNVGGYLDYRPTQNSTIGIALNGNAVSTSSASTYGYSTTIYGTLKDKPRNLTFTASCGYQHNGQKIKMGFNEETENADKLRVQLGVQKNNTQVYVGAVSNQDRLNPTRNYYSAQVGLKVNL